MLIGQTTIKFLTAHPGAYDFGDWGLIALSGVLYYCVVVVVVIIIVVVIIVVIVVT